MARRVKMRNEVERGMILRQEKTLVENMQKRRMTLFGHVTCLETEWIPEKALNCHDMEGKTKNDSPRPKIEHVNEDIKARKLI